METGTNVKEPDTKSPGQRTLKRGLRVALRFSDGRVSESWMLGAAALMVGLAAGAGVWLFKLLFNAIGRGAFGVLGDWLAGAGPWAIVLVPVLGGLLVGVIRQFLIGHERYHGVAGVMEAVALGGGRLPYRQLPAKTVAAALSIGFGASVGPEDPSVQIGANLASMFGQLARLSPLRMRTLVGAGTAAGIAAAFNAPIAGVFFALELMLGEFSGAAFGIVVLSAVISAIFTQAVSGPQPAFAVPPYPFTSVVELPLYLALGLLAGLVAVLYIRSIYKAQDIFASWRLPVWLQPAVAGLAVGLVGIFLPRVFGVGYQTIGDIFSGVSFSVWLLLALLAAKLLMTATSIAGGFPGGLFAPSLFLGATLGAAFGVVVQSVFPALEASPAAFAMVGMAAVLAATVHAPLTAILLLFEMTNDYRIILPLMAAVIVAMVIAQRIEPDSIYTLALARRGIRLERGRDVELLEGITVADVMQPETTVLRETDTLAAASDIFLRTRHHGLPVVNNQGELVGILTLHDMETAHDAGVALTRPVGDICTRDLLVAHPDETIGEALRRMSGQDVGRLPVVPRDDPRRLLGILRRNDVVRAYDMALTRRAAARNRMQEVRISALAGSRAVTVDEMVVQPGAPAAGRRVCDVPWPHDSMIVTLRRGRQVLIPHGDTTLRSGDVLVAVAEGDAREKVRRLCEGSAPAADE